jgi:hypothetical protein
MVISIYYRESVVSRTFTEELNKKLYELEPEDIHLQLELNDF